MNRIGAPRVLIRVAILSIGCLLAADGPPVSGPAPSVAAAEQPVAVPEPSARAISYARGNLGLWFLNQAWAIAIPVMIVVSGLSAKLRNLGLKIGRRKIPAIAAFAALYFGLVAIIDLPLDFYEGFLRQHAYGLSKKSADRWLLDWLKAQGIGIGLAVLFLWLPYLVIRRSPRRWWLWLGLLWIPGLFAIAMVKPVAFDPLFNRFGPMHDRALEAEILSLARRAGIDDGRVFEVDKARDTTAVNAYVTGLFGSKRIVVWDTLLAKLDDREVLFVVGHEVGHYVLDHVISGLLVASTLTLIGLAIVRSLANRLLGRSKQRWGVEGVADVASLPLVIALGHLVAIPLTPIGFAYSRHMEHEADRFAIEITRANHAGATSFSKLQRENLSVPRPDPFSRIVRSTHPSLAERIEFCNDYHPWRDGTPLVYARRFRPDPARP